MTRRGLPAHASTISARTPVRTPSPFHRRGRTDARPAEVHAVAPRSLAPAGVPLRCTCVSFCQRSILAAVVVLLPCSSCDRSRPARPAVKSVSPRLVSDQTSYPLMLYGTAFGPGMTVRIDGAGTTETATADVI